MTKKKSVVKKTVKPKEVGSKYEKKLKIKEGTEWTDLVNLSLKPNKKAKP